MKNDDSLPIITVIGGGAVVVAVVWTCITGAIVQFVPIGIAIGMGLLAAKAAHSEPAKKGRRGKRK